ncbi:hypothetical protein [Candidatus Williamhamiltonella defendens]|uniref:hypothetical protein n=1 Tax=Candidatus Williamhamiltonella defendens TaxID=138072 RepID=UPI0011D07F93|nr:hypothetical protein [Candidatus Hamiltonella defensa]
MLQRWHKGTSAFLERLHRHFCLLIEFSSSVMYSAIARARSPATAGLSCRHGLPETHAFSCSIDMHSRTRRKKARHGPGIGEFVSLWLRKVYACYGRFWLPGKDAHRSRSARHHGTSAAGLHSSTA